jgi:hypothetical protein
LNDVAAPPEALRALLDRLGLSPDIAYDPHWSAAPDFLELIAEHALSAKPNAIVECSSGVTTLVLARCCKLNGSGHVWSLESGAEFALATRAELARQGLTAFATVLDAPLRPSLIDGHDDDWYDLSSLPDMTIDMLVIDGPPAYRQPRARYPALPRLAGRLAASCALFLDDAGRAGEQAIVVDWLRDQPSFSHRYEATARGCTILRR